MGDLKNDVLTGSNSRLIENVKLEIKDEFKNNKIFLPKLNVIDGKQVRTFDYYQDILINVEWEEYQFNKELVLQNKDTFDYNLVKVDVKNKDNNQFELNLKNSERRSEKYEIGIDISLMASQLMDKMPNPWQATAIISDALNSLRKKYSEDVINLNSVYIVDEIKKDCFNWLLEKSENIFKDKLETGIIFLKLVVEPFANLNWQIEEEINVSIGGNESTINFDKNIFQPQYKSLYNDYEYQVASYVNKSEAIKWWHRLGVKGTEYYVSGWKRDKIFPDFLVKIENENGISKLQFIETKGNHLEGNKDTKYKQKVFDYLNSLAKKEIASIGELKLIKDQDELNFQMVFQDDWKTDIKKII